MYINEEAFVNDDWDKTLPEMGNLSNIYTNESLLFMIIMTWFLKIMVFGSRNYMSDEDIILMLVAQNPLVTRTIQ